MDNLDNTGYGKRTKSGSITQVNPKRKVAESALSAAKALARQIQKEGVEKVTG